MGADILYTEEIIDKKLVQCQRSENTELGTIDYSYDKGLCLRLLPDEPLVLQIGTANSSIALQAARLAEKDVKAVDVNMGCPKHFSISGGMGAALLKNPDNVEDILKTLKRNLSVPVSCKIRLLEDMRDTVELVKRIERCGVDALAVHARLVEDRSSVAAAIDCVRDVVQAVNIPVIHNADVFSYTDIARARERTGAHAVMIARGAQWNPSVFRRDGPLPLIQVIRQYLELAIKYDNHYKNTKFVLLKMLELQKLSGRELYEGISRAKDHAEMLSLLDVYGVHEASLVGDYVVPVQLKPRERYPAKRVLEQEAKDESAEKKVR
jgi:tRNA-dihydrouridine synthase 2